VLRFIVIKCLNLSSDFSVFLCLNHAVVPHDSEGCCRVTMHQNQWSLVRDTDTDCRDDQVTVMSHSVEGMHTQLIVLISV